MESSASTNYATKKGRHRNLGRQARKRRRKALEIEAVAFAHIASSVAAATASTADDNKNNQNGSKRTARNGISNNEELNEANRISSSKVNILPTDRSYVLEDVEACSQLNERDRHDLVRQLGYLPGNGMSVAARIRDFFSTEDIEQILINILHSSCERNRAVVQDSNEKHCTENKKLPGKKTTITTEMIKKIMNEPLTVKLYPLVLRDESSSTKNRRKRRRVEDTASAQMNQRQKSLFDTKSVPLMEPFPTIYWVTHPLIKGLISKLELDRCVYHFERRLAEGETEKSEIVVRQNNNNNHDNDNDNSWNKARFIESCSSRSSSSPLAEMKLAHESYGNERWKMLSSSDMEYVKYRRWDQSAFSKNCGVAGIRNPKAVKCLHAHAAHFFSGNCNNVVGRWVWERLKAQSSVNL